MILSVIPARGGWKGLPKKNVRLLRGKPVVDYTIEASLGCKYPLRTIVSTDDLEIVEVAQKAGAEVPFMRPKELATNETPTHPVLLHTIETLRQQEEYNPDTILLLQPTSPLRSSHRIDEALDIFFETQCDSVVSLCLAEHSPHWMRTIDAEGRVQPLLLTERTILRWQDLPPVYRLNGAIYITKPDVVENPGTDSGFRHPGVRHVARVLH